MSVTAAPSLIRELEAVIAHGPVEMRTEKLRQITTLFLETAPLLSDNQIRVFGDVFDRLIETTDGRARAEFSTRLAPVKNAPPGIARRLARDDDIAVAGPVLAQSPQLDDADLLDLAQSMGQTHLLAISWRPALGRTITDVLVQRGDRDVVRKLAGNPNARLSKSGYCNLVERAQNDSLLAQEVARRPDIVDYLCEIGRALEEISDELESRAKPDYAASGSTGQPLPEPGELSDPQRSASANSEGYEETVAALAEIAAVPIEVVDRVMAADRPDPVLILCKAVGLDWPTTRSLILARPASTGITSWVLESASINFATLPVASAKRVVRFWQAGQDCRA
jgi:uncharacterized protein (DUF2336 family)